MPGYIWGKVIMCVCISVVMKKGNNLQSRNAVSSWNHFCTQDLSQLQESLDSRASHLPRGWWPQLSATEPKAEPALLHVEQAHCMFLGSNLELVLTTITIILMSHTAQPTGVPHRTPGSKGITMVNFLQISGTVREQQCYCQFAAHFNFSALSLQQVSHLQFNR